jgi:hypothetical protein
MKRILLLRLWAGIIVVLFLQEQENAKASG